MVPFLQACLNGLLTGALYSLIGMGLALIFGVMRIVNFAHGAFLMAGMYATYLLFDPLKINPYLGFLPAGIFMFGFGRLIYQVLIHPLRNRPHFMQILMTAGIGLILVDSAQLIFHADYRQTNIDLINRTLHLGPFTANAAEVLSFGIAAALVAGLHFYVTRSLTGQALRAIAQNPEVAPLMGINVTRIQGFSFALGTALAGIAGGLLLPRLYLFPSVGEDFTTKAFVMVVLGGMGSMEGAALGGLVLGLAENLTSLYAGNQWALVVDFILFLIVLSFKPSGIFGRQRA
ncbi:MAG TPA: branched-chain amino acid ABC transporter permease [Candidatus Saccharimonadales bacterium]|nr:branched-chain amino acid ABC transporter permease [Candidatus Saccharimonadales bacterium]